MSPTEREMTKLSRKKRRLYAWAGMLIVSFALTVSFVIIGFLRTYAARWDLALGALIGAFATAQIVRWTWRQLTSQPPPAPPSKEGR